MRRLPAILLGLGVAYIAGHVAATVLGMTPDAFFSLALTIAGALLGYTVALFGLFVVIAQLRGATG